MKKFFISFFVLLFLISAVPVFAADDNVLSNNKEIEVSTTTELTGFIPSGYNYYLAERWNGDDNYYLCFFKSLPYLDSTEYSQSQTFENRYRFFAQNGETIEFYCFKTYDEMLDYLVYNDASAAPVLYSKKSADSGSLNLTNDNMYFANFDLIFADTGETYFLKKSYSKTVSEVISDDKTYIVDTFDSDYIVDGVLSEVLSILPLLIVVLCGFASIRKAIEFLRSLLGGA